MNYAFSISLSRFLLRQTRRFDLIHITSTFSFPALAAGLAARQANIPYVVSPRGSLQGWSLGQKRWKKIPYWWMYERAHLERAAGIHVTADIERDAVQAILPHVPVFVVPNAIEPIALAPIDRAPARIAFLGRIHKKKGFDVLVPALARVTQAMPEVETVVAGPDEDGEWTRVKSLIEKAMPRPRVRYIGPVNGPERFKFLAEATVFVLPSHAENFGMTVIEAMACGTPVVVSRNCPWERVESEGAGMWVENTPAKVAEALLRILRDPDAAARMGEAARRLAAEYSWSAVGSGMKSAYERVLAGQRRGRSYGEDVAEQ